MPDADSSHAILYAAEFSLYSGKARAYLRYKGIPYEEKLATLLTYKRVIIPNTGVRFIPVVRTADGRYVQDTTEIIDTLEADYPGPSVYPPTPRQRLAALLLELYADEWLLIPAMYYRWRFPEQNEAFIMGEFGRLALPWAPAFLRRMAGRKLGANFAGLLPALGIDDNTAPAIEAWYLETLDHLDAHFSQHRYLFGDRASIGDFGLIAPLYAHLYRDPAPGAIMRERAPNLVRWVERLFEEKPRPDNWLPDDEVPRTLLPLLRRQFSEQFPVLRETATAVADWVRQNPGQRLPRKVGEHRYRLGDRETTRAILSYPLWMLQRPLDYYQGLPAHERAEADRLLEQCGGREAMDYQLPQRVKRENNRLYPA